MIASTADDSFLAPSHGLRLMRAALEEAPQQGERTCELNKSAVRWWKSIGRPICTCRGIDVVRNKIKMFAQTKVTLPPGRHKMVILDEADRWGPPS